MIGSVLVLSFLKIKNFSFYLIISFITLLLTTKGTIYAFIVFYIIFILHHQRDKINVKTLIMSSVGIILISSYQIKTYISNSDSVRMVFLRFAVKTANDYFPLGSGFATYGSAEAAKNYSFLYFKYGFDQIWGLSEKLGMFLHDNYWATIIAELGYIGFILMLMIFYSLYKIFNDYRMPIVRQKYLIIAALLMMVVNSIGTGIIKSDGGVFLFTLLAVLVPKHANIQN